MVNKKSPMKKIHILIVLMFGFFLPTLAQTLTPRVICSGYGSGQGGGIKLNYTIGETFVTTLRSGNTVLTQGFHQPEIVLCPTAPLVAVTPVNITVNCDEFIPQYDPGFYMENGTAVTSQLTTAEAFDGCTRTFTETWVGINTCGDSTVVERIVTQTDLTAPIFSFAFSEFTAECNDAVIQWPNVLATDNCTSPDFTYSESIISGDCINNYDIERTYFASDVCGNTTTQVITAHVRDTTAPVFTRLPDAGELSCLGQINYYLFEAADNCSSVTLSISTDETEIPGGYSVVTTCQALDECGNSTFASVTNTAPLGFPGSPCNDGLICTSNDIVDENCGCSGSLIDVNNNDICDYVEPLSITATSLTFCPGEDVTLTVANPIAGINYAWSNNSSGTTITVNPQTSTEFTVTTVIDNQFISASIQLTALPQFDFYLDADGDGLGFGPIVFTTCDESLPGYTLNNLDCDDSNASVFEGAPCFDGDICTVNDVFTADCVCIGIYVGDDDNDGICNALDSCAGRPIATLTPADLTLSCDDEIPAFDPGFYMADGSDVFVTQTASVTYDGCSTRIIQVWTGTNDCNESTSVYRNITQNDYDAPVFLNTPADVTINCNAFDNFSPSIPEATDNCSTPAVSFTTLRIDGDCPNSYTIRYTVEATDACGNTNTINFNVFVVDQIAPIFSDRPADRTVSCEDFVDLPVALPSATDNCSSNLYITYTESILPGYCPSNYTVQYTYTALDECGNQAEDSYNVEVIDYTAPIIELSFTGGQFECIGEIADRGFTATDNCSQTSLSYSSIESLVGDSYIVNTTYTAVDDCGNSTSITVTDTTALGNVGSPCDDGLYCTTNDVVTEDCGCVGSFIDSDGNFVCDFIDNFTITTNSLTFCPGDEIMLSVSEPINGVSYFWSNNMMGSSIQVSPNQFTSYSVTATIDGQSILASVNLVALPINTFYADSDGDGYGNALETLASCEESLQGFVLNNLDCDDSTYGMYPTASCDDGDPCTVNDIVQSDCTCAGTFADADFDGTCDANDLCSDGPEPGSECDDRDDCTVDDMIQADCSCAGVYLDSDADGTCDAFDLCANSPEPGMACNDGNPCTINDTVDENCNCRGTQAETAVSVTTIHTCEPYTWNGQTYAVSGNYTFATQTTLGCDSLARLALTVGTPTFSNESVTNCGSYTWNGTSYSLSGTYTYVTTNSTGCPKTETLNLTVNTLSTAASSVVASANNVSAGTSVTLTVQGGSLGTGASWKWYRSACGGTLIGIGTSITITANATDTYFVRAEGTCNTTTCVPVTVTVLSGQCGPELVSASSTRICSGSSTTLSVLGTLYPGAIWRWRRNSCSGTIVGTGANLVVTPTATTTYYVRAEGGTCGITLCLAITIVVDKMPATPSVISGPTTGLCNAQNVTYSVTSVSTVQQYNWTVPPGITIVSGQGTASVTVNVSNFINTNPTNGNPAICVTAQNSCGISPIRCLSLTTYPATPASISGTATPCINTVNTYSCPAVFGATSYTWQVPTGWVIQSGQGTSSISVLCNGTSGNVRVRSINACGNSTFRTLACAPRACGTTAMPMQLELWPNPTSDRVFFAHGDAIPTHMQIYDMLGRDIYNGPWVPEYDVSGLAGGIYFVRATGGGESVVKRMEVVR
jgi:hypothetical protein